MDWKKLKQFLNYSSLKTNKSQLILFIFAILNSIYYNISILEYFQFNFYCISKEEKKSWAGTGYMYEYQLIMNPKSNRDILDDKRKFYEKYKRFFIHKVYNLKEIQNDYNLIDEILNNPSGKLVFKLANGRCGAQVVTKPANDFSGTSVLKYMQINNFELVEEFVQQHSILNTLSSSAVNTVRIITQLDKYDNVKILGCRLRISVKSNVDNFAAGNLAAAVDENTGIVTGEAVYSDIYKSDQSVHPVSKVKIKGFTIPFWNETIDLAKKAALLYTQNRSIGWDIVITEKGPGLIEGNHDWCKLLWQLPVKHGLKGLTDLYIKDKLLNFTN